MSRHQTKGQYHYIKAANKSFKMWHCSNRPYFGTAVTNKSCIHEEIKSRLNSGNACYHAVQNLLSFHLLSKNVKIKIYKIIILPSVLHGRETWSLTLSEEHRLRVLQNTVLKRIF
jgi:hypothetical protein